MFENPRRGRQARNFTTNVPKILDRKIVFRTDIFRKLSLGAPEENCRQFAGNKKYVENLKKVSGEIFVVGRKKNFRVNCIENLKKVVLAYATACNTLRFLQQNSCKCK